MSGLHTPHFNVHRIEINLPARDPAETFKYYTEFLGFQGGNCTENDCSVILGAIELSFSRVQNFTPALVEHLEVRLHVSNLNHYYDELKWRFGSRLPLPQLELEIPGVVWLHLDDPNGIRLTFSELGENFLRGHRGGGVEFPAK